MASLLPEFLRERNFSDGLLEQLSDFITACLERDLAALADRGISLLKSGGAFLMLRAAQRKRILSILTKTKQSSKTKRYEIIHHPPFPLLVFALKRTRL